MSQINGGLRKKNSGGEKMEEVVLEVNDLRKNYGELSVLNGLDFKVKKGEIFGLLGPNGAGKTTTLECLVGLREPDAGEIRIMGFDPQQNPRKLKDLVGIQLQVSALPETIKVEEAINFFSFYHGNGKKENIMENLHLEELKKARYQALSTGQKMRLSLTLAMLHNPSLLILDEPTAGLDVASRRALHGLIRELRDRGTTIILSTHDMAEAEALSDRLAILVKGRIRMTGTPREITSTGKGWTKILVKTLGSSLEGKKFPGLLEKEENDGYRVFFTSQVRDGLNMILKVVEAAGDEFVDLRVERPTLEEKFVELTEQAQNVS